MNDASNSVTEMPFLSSSEGNIHTNLGKDRHHQGKQIQVGNCKGPGENYF